MNSQDSSRSIEFAGNIYTLRVQGYRYAVDGELVLKSHIEVLEQTLGSDVNLVIGMLATKPGRLSMPLIEYLAKYTEDAPQFVKMQNQNFLNRRLEFIGADGFDLAKQLLHTLTEEAIIKGLNTWLLRGGVLHTFILKMCIYDPFRSKWMCIFQSEPIQAFSPPHSYNYSGQKFTLASRFPQDNTTYCMYIPPSEVEDEV